MQIISYKLWREKDMDRQMKETDREPFLLFAKPFSRITLQRVKDKLLSTVIEVKA